VDAVTKLRDLKQHAVEITFPETPQTSWFGGITNARDVRLDGDNHTIRLTTSGELGPIIQIAAQHQATNIATTEPSLEEVFLRYYEPATAK
jgi:ABC-2 type transport system ATP-binding protein